MSALHLIVFSRAPVPGATKTRLSPPLSPEVARDVHVACLNHVLACVRAWREERALRHASPVRPHLFITPPATQPAFRGAGVHWPGDFALHNQRGDDLGQRMAGALAQVLRLKPDDNARDAAALLIGCDLPLLRPEHLEQAARQLADADTVFAPTPDGGYWLVGTRRDPEPLFRVAGWGEDNVLAGSLKAAQQAGHRVALGPELPDVDTVADIHAVLAHPLAREAREGDPSADGEALALLLRLHREGML